MKLRFLLGTLALASLVSCASKFKKQCEATNWFEHGKSVALSGNRLNSNDFVQRCQKEDVDVNEAQVDLGFKAGMGIYCTARGAEDTGRKGDRLNPNLCDPGIFSALEISWEKGRNEYCSPANGYKVGALGEEYKGVCPEKMEKAFLKRFNRGKMVYFTNMIDAKTQEIRHLENRRNESRGNISRIERQRTQVMAAHKITQLRWSAPNPEAEAKYQSEMDTLDSRLRSEQREARNLDTKIEGLQAEIADLRVKRGAFSE